VRGNARVEVGIRFVFRVNARTLKGDVFKKGGREGETKGGSLNTTNMRLVLARACEQLFLRQPPWGVLGI